MNGVMIWVPNTERKVSARCLSGSVSMSLIIFGVILGRRCDLVTCRGILIVLDYLVLPSFGDVPSSGLSYTFGMSLYPQGVFKPMSSDVQVRFMPTVTSQHGKLTVPFPPTYIIWLTFQKGFSIFFSVLRCLS